MQREPHHELAPADRLAWPGFVLDLGRGELFDDTGGPAEVRAQALKLLLVLGEQAGQVVGKDELMQRVWGDVVVTEESLVQAIGDIRRVLGDQAHARIRTVPRRGYMLVVEATSAGGVAPPAPAAGAAAAPSTLEPPPRPLVARPARRCWSWVPSTRATAPTCRA